MSRDLLVIVTIKNNALLTAMRAAGCETAAALARDSGLSYTRVGGTEDFWLIITLLGVTMSEKSSTPQQRRSVSRVLTSDTKQSPANTGRFVSTEVRQSHWRCPIKMS